ncbi:MAG: isoamylase early set domain-containing protein [Verrucomicrobiota bacterium]|nr:isoamylase early set domain-containing protein [Verrucomicrobiota bacterium]
MMTSPSLAGKRRVAFSIKADQGGEVYVAGSFNEWSPKKSRLAYKSGAYVTTLMLPKGRHEYKFVIDGVWCVDPECPEWTPNGLGSLNSVLTVT